MHQANVHLHRCLRTHQANVHLRRCTCKPKQKSACRDTQHARTYSRLTFFFFAAAAPSPSSSLRSLPKSWTPVRLAPPLFCACACIICCCRCWCCCCSSPSLSEKRGSALHGGHDQTSLAWLAAHKT